MTSKQCPSQRRPLNRQETADYLGYSVSRLNTLASEGKKPIYRKVGKEAYYHPSDLDDFEKDEQTF